MSALPAKYAGLGRAREVAAVPPATLLDGAHFARIIADHAGIDRRLDAVLKDIELTSGATLNRHLPQLADILGGLRLTADAAEVIAAELGPRFPDWAGTAFAVRSAALEEDLAERSSAGLYDSVLDVRGAQALGAALLKVWASYFARAAIVERLAAGTLASGQRMMAIVQPMVAARHAGVVFTLDPVSNRPPMVLEWVRGTGEALVSGHARSSRLHDGALPAADPEGELPAAVAREVFATAARLKEHFATEVDVEWAWDGDRVQVLQVRPISTAMAAAHAAGPVLKVASLYEADDAELAGFGPLPEFARYFRGKRRPLQLFAAELGLERTAALLLRCNRAGLDQAKASPAFAAMLRTERVVIDASDQVRQVIVPGADLLDTLRPLCRPPAALQTIALREFTAGRVGLITQLAADGGVVMEYSGDGLLALNRGTGEAVLCAVEADGAGRPDWLTLRQAELLWRATRASTARFGRIQIEWVHDGRRLLMLDYSPVSTPLPVAVQGHAGIVSPGFARAPILRVEASTALEALSEGPSISISSTPQADRLGGYVEDQIASIRRLPAPPIIVCRRPYALLAALIPHVAGFVFESGSLLSHLAILIRESGKPALASATGYAQLKGSGWATLRLSRDPEQLPGLDFLADPA